MKQAKILGIVSVLSLCLGLPAAHAKELKLWGKQTKGWGATNAKKEGNKITVEGTAKVVKVEGDAKSYCIWKQGGHRGYLCGAKGKSIVDKTLPAGNYTVLPGLSDGQSSAKITIHLSE